MGSTKKYEEEKKKRHNFWSTV